MQIGDKVIYQGEGFSITGKVLTVERIKRIESEYIPSYNRIQAGFYDGSFDSGMVEAREDLFRAA